MDYGSSFCKLGIMYTRIQCAYTYMYVSIQYTYTYILRIQKEMWKYKVVV